MSRSAAQCLAVRLTRRIPQTSAALEGTDAHSLKKLRAEDKPAGLKEMMVRTCGLISYTFLMFRFNNSHKLVSFPPICRFSFTTSNVKTVSVQEV